MLKIFVTGALALASAACAAADLTDTETRWLQGAMPVIAYAQQELRLPLDIVVQPQPAPGLPPLALGYVGGRCKLVLSMRGNPEAEATLARLSPDLRHPALELMTAHELGHCRRYLDGAWMGVPSGFVPATPPGLKPELRQAWLDMSGTRREEAYGDLVGLAWTQQHHAALYGRLHGWLVTERSRELIPGSHHDTLAWLKLADDGRALAGASLFEGAAALWRAGVLTAD